MSLWAIVPVKPLRRGKSRLARVLSEEERTFLNYNMLGNTMKVLTNVPAISQVLVISRDPAALVLARNFGARTVMEDSNSELNMALQRATIVAMISSASSVLILPADLPLITVEGVQELIERANKPPEIIITPDRRGEGTNALLLNPAGIITYSFGPDSFKKHVKQAEKYSIRVDVYENPSLALDLDLPEDLELLRQMESTQLIES
jgi:2-phospho-L-lactate guanylyltransferase